MGAVTTGGLIHLQETPEGGGRYMVLLPDTPEWARVGTPVLVIRDPGVADVRAARLADDLAAIVRRLLPDALSKWDIDPALRGELWEQFLHGGFNWSPGEVAALHHVRQQERRHATVRTGSMDDPDAPWAPRQQVERQPGPCSLCGAPTTRPDQMDVCDECYGSTGP
jgi:hypothetical protein